MSLLFQFPSTLQKSLIMYSNNFSSKPKEQNPRSLLSIDMTVSYCTYLQRKNFLSNQSDIFLKCKLIFLLKNMIYFARVKCMHIALMTTRCYPQLKGIESAPLFKQGYICITYTYPLARAYTDPVHVA